MAKKDQIRGRFKIREFINLVNEKKVNINPKNIYNVILRVYSPEHPKNSALLKITAKGNMILDKMQNEINTIKNKDIIAFCNFQIEQVMRG
jgi:hypothetical protein